MLVLSLLACSDSVALGPVGVAEGDLPVVTCADGEIRVASSGAAFPTLTDAMLAAADEDHICVGAGTWNLVEDASCAAREAAFSGRSLTVEGAGSDRTILRGGGDSCAELYFGAESEDEVRALRGVSLWSAPVMFWDGDVSLSDVRVANYAGGTRALWVHADTLEVRGLTLADNVVDYGAGFELYGHGTIEGLVVEGNRSAAGYVGELSGTLAWRGGHVAGNTRTGEDPGYDFLETWGDVSIENVGFFDNVANGPILTGHGRLALTDTSFLGNDSNWHGVLTGNDAIVMTGGAIRGNEGADGAIALYGVGNADLRGVDIEANGECAVSGDGACLASDPGVDATLVCDVAGCE